MHVTTRCLFMYFKPNVQSNIGNVSDYCWTRLFTEFFRIALMQNDYGFTDHRSIIIWSLVWNIYCEEIDSYFSLNFDKFAAICLLSEGEH